MRTDAEWLDRKALRFLGIAMAISVVLAFPIEQLTHQGYAPRVYWPHSCSDAELGLNIGNVIQALLAPLFVFVLPGAGSIVQRRSKARSDRATPEASASGVNGVVEVSSLRNVWLPSVRFISISCLFAAAISVVWWYLLRADTSIRKGCPALYDSSLPVHRYHPDFVWDFYHYYILVSLFAAFWTGISAGALRAYSARVSEDSSSPASQQFESFYWACFLGWAVQYRLSQWFATPVTNQDWVSLSGLGFTFTIVSSFCVLPFIRPIWRKTPRNWWIAVVGVFGRSLLIYGLTILCFFWLVIYAFLPVIPPLVTWNAFGVTWAVVIGTWHWRGLKKKHDSGKAVIRAVRG